MQDIIDGLETEAVSIHRAITKLLKKKADEDLKDLLEQAQDMSHKLASILRDCAIAAGE